MNINLTDKNLTENEKNEIENLLKREKHGLENLEQMWYLIDLVWGDYGCDNKNLDWGKIGRFYSHPVWLLNGLFIEQHDLSMQHRHAISDWVIQNNFENVIDYGGGFGTLARLIAKKSQKIKIDIYEPHPTEFGLKRLAEFKNINIISRLGFNYDCLLCTDVLEHVPDPLRDLAEMIKSVKTKGYLVIANAFYPMIKCHLPQNFHYRYSFNVFAKIMGLEVIGPLEGSHATIYRKVRDIGFNWRKIRFYEKLSKIVFPMIELLKPFLKSIKRLVKR